MRYQFTTGRKGNSMKHYPILHSNGEYIPFDMMLEHEEQCLSNHSQSVETLASRGGTCYLETYYILNNSPYKMHHPKDHEEYDILEFKARRIVHALVYEWIMKNNMLN